MIIALAAAAALFTGLVLIPGAVVTAILCGHRNPEDFDRNPEGMDESYRPFREAILEEIRWMRGQAHERVGIRARDGAELKAEWYPRGPRAVLCMHGYKATPLNNFARLGHLLLEEGRSVLMVYERGHGPSGGLCSLGVKEADDIREWVSWLTDRAGCTEVAVYGMSMGGAAVNLASGGAWPEAVTALVPDCGYYSMEDQMTALMRNMAFHRRMIAPFIRLNMKLLFRKEMRRDGRESLRTASRPMLFLGGTEDGVVSPETVREAYALCGAEKNLMIVDKAPHTMALYAGGQEERQFVLDFMARSEEK